MKENVLFTEEENDLLEINDDLMGFSVSGGSSSAQTKHKTATYSNDEF